MRDDHEPAIYGFSDGGMIFEDDGDEPDPELYGKGRIRSQHSVEWHRAHNKCWDWREEKWIPTAEWDAKYGRGRRAGPPLPLA